MVDGNMMERVAKNVGCSVAALESRHARVLEAHGLSMQAAGLSQDEVQTKTLRMAAAEMRSEKAKLSRSGCVMLEGMFLSSPRYKDWGKVFYNKYKDLLASLDGEGRKALVAQGLVSLYLIDDLEGGYKMLHNPSLTNKTAFAEGVAETHTETLPKQATRIDDGTGYFVCIENKTAPTYPSGSPNYSYGKARATQDLERTCLFIGRKVGDSGAPTVIPMKFRGDLAKVNYPTFMPLTIPANLSKNGTAYAKAGVSTYTLDESVKQIFSAPPHLPTGEGLIADNMKVLKALDEIESFVGTLSDKEKWDALCAVVLEVAHIDPREKGGAIITLSDLDLMSSAPPLDLYVNMEEDSKLDFGVGSLLVVVGQPYVGREGDGRLATTGWWCVENMASAMPAAEDAEEDDEWE